MRQLFSVFLFSFASLFFSQCEIGEISFALEDVLTFFKVEWKYKKNKIQKIDKFELEAKEKEQNIIQKTQEISIPAKQTAENVIGRELLGIERPQMQPELIDEIYLHDVKSENKIEGKDNFLIEGNNNEDVSDVNLNVNLEKLKNNDTTTPRHNRNLSNMSESSFYSGISTTVSQALQNNDGHNVVKKGVFDFAKNSSSPKRDLINSFNNTQAEEEDSCDKGEELLKKTDTYFVEKKRVDSDKGEQLKRVIRTDYRNLIKKKIRKQNDQKHTFSLVRQEKGSSIFVPIENNKISQEGGNNICKEVKNSRIGDKKDGHKNVNIIGADTNMGCDRIIDQNMNTTVCNDFVNKHVFTLLNSSKEQHRKKSRQSQIHKNNIKKENCYCKLDINNNGKKRRIEEIRE